MDAFANFRKTLDREMKRLTKTGNGTVKKQVEALTDEVKSFFGVKKIILQSHYSIPSFIQFHLQQCSGITIINHYY